MYDATVAKTSLKIASSSLLIFFAIMSVCLTFESWRNHSGTEFREAVSKLGTKIRGCVFTFSVKLEKWSRRRTGKKCKEIKVKKHVQSFCLCLLSLQNLWPCRCRCVVDFKLPYVCGRKIK